MAEPARASSGHGPESGRAGVARGMGRGLAAIISSPQVADSGLRELPVELIGSNPTQPRRVCASMTHQRADARLLGGPLSRAMTML